ncbi:SCO family protein [Sediminitomix flava]|uniref:SCO family protein n=1 Tax=Sediminitomix flava TaxID=379075 RepID=UPI000D6C98C8|nr:SCO family protein [Sediminitomix flava]
MKNSTLILLFSILTTVSSCSLNSRGKGNRNNRLPYYKEASFTPYWLSKDTTELKDFHTIPSFSLVSQKGDTITENSFEGKIYVTDFFFTSCQGICPQMTSNMKIIQDEFENDNEILLLSHSITPRKDSPQMLKAYAQKKGIDDDKWILATGNRIDIYELGRKGYFIEKDLGINKGPNDFLHSPNFVLVDKEKHIRGIYNGLNSNAVQQLITDIKTLKKEYL